MLGMSPSLCLDGSVSFVATGLSLQAATFGIDVCLRHLPIWMTSGIDAPSGAFGMVNFPVASVTAAAIGSPE